MERFEALPAEKQARIIDGALKVFGENTYRKASAGDIAGAAGISKGMVFHYFGSKKSLYMYLLDYCGRLLTSEMEDGFDPDIVDLFDKIKMLTLIKISAIKKHPGILSFLYNAYSEADPEVAVDVRKAASEGIAGTWGMTLENIDLSRFRNPEAPELLTKFLTWAGEGAAKDWAAGDDIDARLAEFIACIDLLKENFYR